MRERRRNRLFGSPQSPRIQAGRAAGSGFRPACVGKRAPRRWTEIIGAPYWIKVRTPMYQKLPSNFLSFHGARNCCRGAFSELVLEVAMRPEKSKIASRFQALD